MLWWLRQESKVTLTCTALSMLIWLTRTLPLKECSETLQLSNCTHGYRWRAREDWEAIVGWGKSSRSLWRCSLSEVNSWLCSLGKEGLLASVEAKQDASGINRRTTVSANPLASAKTTRFLLGPPPPSLRKQLRGSVITTEEDGGEDE